LAHFQMLSTRYHIIYTQTQKSKQEREKIHFIHYFF